MFSIEKEKRFSDLVLVCFQLRIRSAIYSSPGGANGYEPNERLQPFDPTVGCPTTHPTVTTVGSPTVATVGIPTVLERVRSDPDSGAGPVRVGSGMLAIHTRRPDSKRTRPGREPEPEPRPRPGPEPEPEPGPAAAAAASGGARAQVRA